jgi:hypothetical protein
MEQIEIKTWSSLKDNTWSSLLLGNGASIAIHPGFNYASLRDVAKNNRLLTTADTVFGSYNTSNFEYVLEALDHGRRVNAALGTPQQNVIRAYDEVRAALIEAVRHVHCGPDYVRRHIRPLVAFLKCFKTVVTFNYDLTLYWTMLEGNSQLGSTWFKDGFIDGEFVAWWPSLRDARLPATGATLVFFGHGSLVLGRDASGNEVKLAADQASPGWDTALLNTITAAWTNGTHTPLFVSECSSPEKLRAIRSSRYLSAVHDQVLGNLGESVVTYGFGFAQNDEHVLRAMAAQKKAPKRLAVSVFTKQPPGQQQAFCQYVLSAVRSALGTEVRVDFFDHASAGCWINPCNP